MLRDRLPTQRDCHLVVCIQVAVAPLGNGRQLAIGAKLARMMSKGQLKRLIQATKRALPPRPRSFDDSASVQVGQLVPMGK